MSIFKICASLCIGIILLSACSSPTRIASPKGKNTNQLSEKDERQFANLYLDANRAKILGNYAQAVELFSQCIAINPQSAAAKYEIARIQSSNGNYTGALGYAKDAYAIDPENPWYAEFLGQLYAETGQLEMSAEVFEDMIAKDPGNVNNYFNLGSVLSAQGKYDEVIKLYDRLEERVGSSEELVMQKQMLYIEQGDYDSALKEVQKLIDANPDAIQLYGMKAEIFERQGNDEKAMQLYEELLLREPSNGLVLLSLYELNNKKGNRQAAENYLLKAFAATDLSIDVKVNILLNYLSSRDLAGNAEYITQLSDQMLIAHPNDAKAFAIYGDVLFNLNRLEESREKFRKAVELDPNRPPIWQQILTIDSQLSDFDAMVQESAQAMEIFPEQPVFYLFNGVANLQIKQVDKAIEALQTGKNLVVDNNALLAQFYASLGDAFHEKGDNPSSDSAYEMSLKYDPNNTVVMNNYAYYLALRKINLEKAEELAKKANNLNPDVASFQDTYGWVLYQRNNYQNALFWIEQALKNGGANDSTVLDHYGDVLLKLSRKTEAAEAWQKAIDAGGDPELIMPKITLAQP